MIGNRPSVTDCALVQPVRSEKHEWQDFRLRRHGVSPLRFVGWMLHLRTGRPSLRSNSLSFWHELGLYQTVCGAFVVEIVAWTSNAAGEERRVRCHALEFESVTAALNAIEYHDPGVDICVYDLYIFNKDDQLEINCITNNNIKRDLQFLFENIKIKFAKLIGEFIYEIGIKFDHSIF